MNEDWKERFEDDINNDQNESEWCICEGEDINIIGKPEKEQYFPFSSVEVCEILVFFYNRTKNTATLYREEFTDEQIEKLKEYEV